MSFLHLCVFIVPLNSAFVTLQRGKRGLRIVKCHSTVRREAQFYLLSALFSVIIHNEHKKGGKHVVEQEVTRIVAKNIKLLRMKNHLTQAQLAEKINYSDKSISKWERAEGMPDVFVLMTMCAFFHVSMEQILYEKVNIKEEKRDKRHDLVFLLSVGLVWLVATVFFSFIRLLHVQWDYAWLVYIYAIPASSIVAVVFTAMWYKWYALFISVTCLIFSIPLSITLSFKNTDTYLLFIVAGVLEVLTVLWFILKNEMSRRKARQHKEEGIG